MSGSGLRRWRRQIGALLLRDAVRRFGFGLAVAMVPVAWIWRIWPPWELRALLWRLDLRAGVGVGVAAAVLWAVLTAPVVRLLLRSARLEYWRQFPISRAQWLRLHAVHVACIDAPAIGLVLYVLVPWRDAIAIAGVTTGLVVLIVVVQIALAFAPLPRTVGSPRSRTAVGALARLHAVTVLRRDRSAAWFAIAVQLVALAWIAIGVDNVATDDPGGASSLLGGASIVACSAAAWLVLRAQRVVDRDRWYLDAQAAVHPSAELRARLLLGLVFTTPTLVGLVVAAAPIGLAGVARTALVAAVVGSWSATAFTRIGARAEASRNLHAPQHVAAIGALAYGLAVTVVLDPIALVVPCAIELVVARRALARATAERIRFETTHREDDHA